MKPRRQFLNTGERLALIAILAVIALIALGREGLFSPGPLSAQVARSTQAAPVSRSVQAPQSTIGGVSSHAELSGNCGACHAAPWSSDVMGDRCMKCHADVSEQLLDPSALHGMVWPTGGTLSCTQGCHTEHKGATANLTPVTTDHFSTRFTFSTKAHQTLSNGLPFKCVDCHKNGLNKIVENTCIECHREIDAAFTQSHLDTFGTSCLQCHDGVDTYGKSFDHAGVPFPLSGKHVTAACAGCHKGASSLSALKATPRDCNSCHKQDDTHRGSLGTNCIQCHNTTDWKQATIDHSRTAYPLTGKHVSVACASCHVNNVYKGTPKDCNSCHKQDDKHNGSLGTNCVQCHNTTDWKQATIDHSRTAYPLTGKHVSVACASCHVNGVYKGTPTDCNSCHKAKDKHNGSYGTLCAQCHNTTDWKQATIDHSKTAYPLTGKHVSVACASCHVNGVYKGTPTDCNSCHKAKDKHNGSYGTLCAQCHNTTDWKQATIDHSKTAYPLTGKHVSVACASCHVNSVYKGTPKDCYSCHKAKDKHNGSYGINCAQCHNTTDWKQATIDHSRTAYPLTGKHISVACASCHVNSVYKGTPKDCYSCHKAKDKHRGAYGQLCAQCHNTTSWPQATIDHSRTAYPLTGRHVTVACARCHVNGVYKGTPTTCYSCHARDDEHRGRNGTDCGRSGCHTTRTWDR